MGYVYAALIGAIFGSSELIARYRDAPFRAIQTLPAILYMSLNAAAAILAYWLVLAFDVTLGLSPTHPALPFVRVAFAGLGAMVIFRSALVQWRISDSDVSIGPNIILEAMKSAADRAVDRALAEPRATMINTIMSGVSFEKAKEALPAHCFTLMQNVSLTEQQQIGREVDRLSVSNMTDRAKALNLGLALMNVVGATVLQAAVKNLGANIR